MRLWDRGRYLTDVVKLIVVATRARRTPRRATCTRRSGATRIAEEEVMRLVGKYGSETITQAFAEVQDYVERLTRQRIAELPDGTWETEDYLDFDPRLGDGLIPVKVKLTIDGDQMQFDLTGSHPAVATFLNGTYGVVVLGRGHRHEDVLPGHPAELGLLPRDRRRPRAGGHGGQRRLADRRDRLLLRRLRQDRQRVLELCGQVVPERAIACCPTSSTC